MKKKHPPFFIFYFLFSIFYFSVASRAIWKPVGLECNGKTNPFYIDSSQPEFSWTIKPDTATQNWYQVQTATSQSFGGDGWDSEKVNSASTSCFYGGPALSGNATYYWRVKTWEVEFDTSPWSDPALFRMNFFLLGSTFATGNISSLGAADLDGDGDTDLVLGGNDGIEMWENDGAGNFTFQLSMQSGKTIGGIVLKDLNGSGLPDVISAVRFIGGNPEASQVFLNDGDFQFNPAGGSEFASKRTESVTVFDMNNDGKFDIIEGLGGTDQQNDFYSGEGDGSFLTPTLVCNTKKTVSIGVADFNNDGNFDIVSLNYGTVSDVATQKAFVYKGDGVGNFETMPWDSGFDYFTAVAVGDINNDGNCDFVAATEKINEEQGSETKIASFLGDGDFGFTREDSWFDLTTAYAISLALADFNNDGWLDLIVGWNDCLPDNGLTRFYLNNGDGTFSLLDKSENKICAHALAAADFNGDGRIDYVSASAGGYEGCNFFYSTLENSNDAPSAPSVSTFSWVNNKLYIGWGDVNDDETPAVALQYNLKLSDESGVIISTVSGNIFSECGGFYGNMMYSSWTLLNIPRQTYFFSVQTVDGQGATSAMSEEKTVNEKPYPGWDAEDVIPSTCCSQFTRSEVEGNPNLKGRIKISFRIKDFEENDCALTEFGYSTDDGNSYHQLPDTDSLLEVFYSSSSHGYSYHSSTGLPVAQNYSFKWNSGSFETASTYTATARVRFKAYDGYSKSVWCVSECFEIDNKKPSAPGVLTPSGKYTGASITLLYGTTSFDENFDGYVIYGNDSPTVDETNYLVKWSSANDVNLSSSTFLGASSTTVTGLVNDTTYYFRIYAYDSFANCDFSAVSPPVKTNDIPFLDVPSLVSQRSDGSGLIDFSFEGFDCDKDTWTYVSVTVRNPAYEYVDTAPVNYDVSFSTPLIFSSGGVVNNYVFSATSTFGSAVCYDNAFLKLKVTDGINDSNELNTSGFKIDTKPPEGITRFKVGDRFSSNIKLQWNLNPWEDFDEPVDNFKEYVVWYGTSPGVTDGSPYYEWNSSSQSTLNDKDTRTARVEGLTPGIEYFFRLYVHDDFGNFCKTSEVSEFTRGGPDSWFNSAQQESTGDGAVSLNVVCLNPDGYNSFLNVCFSTVSNSGPWSKITLSTTVYAYLGGTPVDPPEIINSQTYQVGTAVNPILTSDVSTTTLSLVWKSREEFSSLVSSGVYLRSVVIDTYNVVQSSPGISAPFALDNIDPSLSSCTYKHGDKEYFPAESALLDICLNKNIFAIADYAGIFISTLSVSSPTVTEINITKKELSIIGKTLEFQLIEAKWRQIADFDKNNYDKIFIHISTGTLIDSSGNYNRGVTKKIEWYKDDDPPNLVKVSYLQNPDTKFSGLELEFNEEISGWAEDFGDEIYLSSSTTASSTITFSGRVVIDTETSKIYWLYPDEKTHAEVIMNMEEDILYFSCGRICCDLSGNFLNEISSLSATMIIEMNPPKVEDWSPDGSEKVSPENLLIWVEFSERIYSESISSNSFCLAAVRDKTGKSISEQVDNVEYLYISSTCVLELRPPTLNYGRAYKVTISTTIQDLSLNPLAEEFSFEFETLLDLSVHNILSSGPVTIDISEDALSGTGRIELSLNRENAKILTAFEKESNFNDVFHHRIGNGLVTINVFDENEELQTGNFQSPVWLYFRYDNDNPEDDFVDGEAPPVRVDSLAIYWLNEDRDFWVKVLSSEIDKDSSCVKAQLQHFSSYALMGGTLYGVEGAHPYPVPYKKWEDKDTPVPGIKFMFPGCSQAKIKIYDIMGRLLEEFSYSDAAAEIPGIFTQWPVVDLPSGVYIYRVLSGENDKTGKIIVIQ